ncbi:hypothetical protein BRADI_5g02973v3 [Brachypodium distachyon]|uniref:Knottin scorpion toxin-like domain-containing protein n=1 Tax=Brachypodium distachyon TaxID=15368 RepID=A0A2K2CF46_BRADI|nr:hypothetical protein BRADI_5g02973v3 [Brachypodium distachyon]
MLLLSSDLGSYGCEHQRSSTWLNETCINRGTCNVPCRKEGFDNGTCRSYFTCICSRNCGDGSNPASIS